MRLIFVFILNLIIIGNSYSEDLKKEFRVESGFGKYTIKSKNKKIEGNSHNINFIYKNDKLSFFYNIENKATNKYRDNIGLYYQDNFKQSKFGYKIGISTGFEYAIDNKSKANDFTLFRTTFGLSWYILQSEYLKIKLSQDFSRGSIIGLSSSCSTCQSKEKTNYKPSNIMNTSVEFNLNKYYINITYESSHFNTDKIINQSQETLKLGIGFIIPF